MHTVIIGFLLRKKRMHKEVSECTFLFDQEEVLISVSDRSSWHWLVRDHSKDFETKNYKRPFCKNFLSKIYTVRMIFYFSKVYQRSLPWARFFTMYYLFISLIRFSNVFVTSKSNPEELFRFGPRLPHIIMQLYRICSNQTYGNAYLIRYSCRTGRANIESDSNLPSSQMIFKSSKQK